MAILEILTYPDERLKNLSEDVIEFNDELQAFIANLEETMRAGPGGGELLHLKLVVCNALPLLMSQRRKKSSIMGG